ncbi:pyridoxamine 5'-phosphate oxidase family protein [Streptosporangium sp. NPDC000396]|uniref:pyridoxamine 5'-phosphate oxidase family protein n=1 Tax=Streptosporangium sp. NPDC000396 TaxID=3366185 RepID=UPI003695EA79
MTTTPIDLEVGAIIDTYRTCEFVTLGADGTPLTWPTAAWRRTDGTLLVTTSLAFAQKALNVRRDGRVALLFSDPTGSGRADAPQVFVSGTATCPDEIRTGPDEAADYWRTLFERQPHSRSYVRAPGRWFMDWYYLRLFITVTPTRVEVRPPLAELTATEQPAPATPAATDLPGADLIARFPSAVLGARDASGAPLLVRTRPRATADGFTIVTNAADGIVPGKASLLVHRHDERLNAMHNALIRGELRADGDQWTMVPRKVVEPAGSGRISDAFRVLRAARRSTLRYLERRGLARPRVQWDQFQMLATSRNDA